MERRAFVSISAPGVRPWFLSPGAGHSKSAEDNADQTERHGDNGTGESVPGAETASRIRRVKAPDDQTDQASHSRRDALRLS